MITKNFIFSPFLLYHKFLQMKRGKYPFPPFLQVVGLEPTTAY